MTLKVKTGGKEKDVILKPVRSDGEALYQRWVHNDLATFLDGKLYTERKPRGVYMAPEPYDKWIKPSCVLVCEDKQLEAAVAEMLKAGRQ